MISFLKGKIQNKSLGFIIMRVGDVGYKVYVNTALWADLKVGEEKEVYTHQHVREDALDLFGFKNPEELELFELLISISGVGPKTALGVLSVGTVNDIKDSIAQGDAHLLTKVSGIGKKTAERVVLELKDKMPVLGRSVSGGESGNNMGDEIDALMALGYNLQQAREALKKVDPKIKESGQRIREALKRIGK